MRCSALALLAASALLVACQRAEPPAPAAPATTASAPAAVDYRALLEQPDRYAPDRAKDAARKPWLVFEFAGIQPGMQVLDLLTGGGYTTEYLAAIVGPDGGVTAFNTPAYDNYVREELAARYSTGRLPRVTRLTSEMADLALQPAAFDAIVTVQNYHDLYYVNAPSWPAVDVTTTLARLHAALKPGGVLLVVDHHAAAGSGTSVAGTLHRIEESVVRSDLAAAGFVFEAASDVLANPADDRSKSVFDEAIRGQTDQFVLRFRKPR